MNSISQNDFDRNAATTDAEQSLRLVASLPAPVGIEERVKCGLKDASSQTAVIAWPSSRARWAQVSYLRGAAAAAIVLMVAGGGWGVYAHFGQAPLPAGAVVPQRIEGGGFSSAAARRTPKTVDGSAIAVPTTMRQKAVTGNTSKQHRDVGKHRLNKKNRVSNPAAAPAVR